MAHIYLANPQARVGPMHSLDFSALEELRVSNTTSTSSFKTASTYGTQVVVMCPQTIHLVNIWVSTFRPAVASQDSGDALFLNSLGNPHHSLGSCLTDYFKRYGFHITSTVLRLVLSLLSCFIT
jgi:hypothetical protein